MQFLQAVGDRSLQIILITELQYKKRILDIYICCAYMFLKSLNCIFVKCATYYYELDIHCLSNPNI